MKPILAFSLAAITVACSSPAIAQLASDVVPRERVTPLREQIRKEMEESRHRLGPFRLQPQFSFRDLGYNDNVFGNAENPVSDWTAMAAAGIRWTMPLGPKMYFRGGAVPEYTWYKDLTNRRFLGGTYEGSLVALFNRLTIEATGGTSRTVALVSSEIETPAIARFRNYGANIELDLLKRLSIFGGGETQQTRYQSEGVVGIDPLSTVADLNRDDSAVRAGIRYRSSSALGFTLFAETTKTDFQDELLDRDNTSDAVFLGIHYDRPRAYINVVAGKRQWKPEGTSTFRSYDAPSGSYFVSYSLTKPVELQAYGQRRLIYALFADYFIEDRNGASAIVQLGHRAAFRGFAEIGSNYYPFDTTVGGAPIKRNDDVVTYGGGFGFRIYRNVTFTAIVTQTEFQSNIPAFNRTVMRLQSYLSLTGGFVR